MSERRAEYENYGQKGYVRVVFEEATGGFVVIHPDHGRQEWRQNEIIARLLATRGDAVVLMPATADSLSFDAFRNGEAWEFKTISVSNLRRAVQTALRRAKTQAPNALCFLDSDEQDFDDVIHAIYNTVKFDSSQQLERVSILFRNGKLIEMTREEIKKGVFRSFFYA